MTRFDPPVDPPAITKFANLAFHVPDDAKAILVVIHGLAEHSARYRPTIEFLGERGVGCVSWDQYGHGCAPVSEADRGDVPSFQRFVVDAAAVIEVTRGRYPKLPLFLWGHSMGAVIATLTTAYIAKISPAKIRGVVTSSAPVASFDGVPRWLVNWLKYVALIVPRLRVSRPFKPERLSRDAGVGHRYAEDPLVPRAVTLRLLVQLALACRQCLPAARRLRTPWLALHGDDDEVAPAIGSQRLIDALGSDDKLLRRFPGARHEVHNEIEPTRTQCLQCLADWVSERATQ